MKKVGFIILIVFLLTGCTSASSKQKKEKPSTVKKDSIEQRAEDTMKGMTIEEKIGQMLFVAYRKPAFDENVKEMLKKTKPGGFILFSENFSDYQTSLSFVKKVKETGDIPMFVGIDQEGGLVQRLSRLQDLSVTTIPKMYDVGHKGDVLFTADVARVLAEELQVFGINMNFAPSLDIYSNPDNTVIGKRAFGKTSDVVSTMGLVFGQSLEKNGIVPVYKHFPGHGDTSTDSHYTLPVVNKSLDQLRGSELIPFDNAIQNGAEVMMIGHLAMPSITGDNTPASLSKEIVTHLLKEEMNYKGLVVTDAVNMEALTKNYSYPVIYEKAIEAGVDMIMMPDSPGDAIIAIQDSLARGVITEKRINESVKKILALKYKKIEKRYDEYLPSAYLGSEEHKIAINKLYQT